MANVHTGTSTSPSLHSTNEDAAKAQRIDEALERLVEEHNELTGNERDLEQLLKRLETEEKAKPQHHHGLSQEQG
jgi:prefoldin subunit 5